MKKAFEYSEQYDTPVILHTTTRLSHSREPVTEEPRIANTEKPYVKNAAKIYRRDRRNHASPNSAQTEAAMAGALDVQLAGNAYYFGKLYEKPTIGDAIRPVEVEDIRRSNRLLYATAILGAVIFLLIGSAVRICFFL